MNDILATRESVLFFSMICVFMAFLAPCWAIPTEILSESTAAVAVGMINSVAVVAGFAGPYAFGYLHTRTESHSVGLAVLTVSAIATAILVLLTPRTLAQTYLIVKPARGWALMQSVSGCRMASVNHRP